jgi:hypothetical protein
MHTLALKSVRKTKSSQSFERELMVLQEEANLRAPLSLLQRLCSQIVALPIDRTFNCFTGFAALRKNPSFYSDSYFFAQDHISKSSSLFGA